MKTATKQMIKSALFEATFVVMGVILALAAKLKVSSGQARDNIKQSIRDLSEDLLSRVEKVCGTLNLPMSCSPV